MNIDEAVDYLRANGYGSCISWEIDSRNNLVFGFTFGGKLDSRYSNFEAIAIAEKLHREASPTVAGFSVPWKTGFSCVSDLPPLEWRKRVDKAIECVEFTRQCHNDRFFRGEERLHDHDYRITAWAECVSDALKKIVAQDERIAKLEQSLKDERENGINFACEVGQDAVDCESRLAKLEAKLNEFEATETVDEVVDRITVIESRLNFMQGATLKVIAQDCEKLDSRIDNTVETKAHDALERRVTGLERELANAFLAGKI